KPNLSFSPAVETVIMRALSKQPSERFGSVREFAEALNAAVLAPSPASAPAESTADKPGLFGKMKGLFRRD
ncbi:MAG: hypothetical protein ABI120_07795, partial [Gemmatimonadaceae bacterium]